MIKINLTSQMKEYLYRSMVLTDFELKQIYKEHKRDLLGELQHIECELRAIELKLNEL